MLTVAGRSSTQVEGVSFLHGVKDSQSKGKELVNPSGESQPGLAPAITLLWVPLTETLTEPSLLPDAICSPRDWGPVPA